MKHHFAQGLYVFVCLRVKAQTAWSLMTKHLTSCSSQWHWATLCPQLKQDHCLTGFGPLALRPRTNAPSFWRLGIMHLFSLRLRALCNVVNVSIFTNVETLTFCLVIATPLRHSFGINLFCLNNLQNVYVTNRCMWLVLFCFSGIFTPACLLDAVRWAAAQ